MLLITIIDLHKAFKIDYLESNWNIKVANMDIKFVKFDFELKFITKFQVTNKFFACHLLQN